MSSPVLELHEATVLKDERPVLDNVSLTIPRGEHTAIVGPNGAGKSILVSLLTHFERPVARASGPQPVRVFGKDNWDVFELRSQIGIVSADLHNRFVSGNSEGRITAMTARQAVPRAGLPDEAAEAYLYLMRGTYTTGRSSASMAA